MAAALKPGDTFGRYLVEALLGEGGMGQVYRAFDPLLERRVAIKLLRDLGEAGATDRPGGTPDAASGGSARILREARAAAQLHHPNTATIFDVGEVDGVPYLTMELIAGRPLAACVHDESISTEVRLGWLADVARALAAAHERGLVHRDIKLENVMVRSDGVIKVLDFGIARRRSSDVNPMTATAPAVSALAATTGGVSGTPLYMAPEQLRGEPVDGRADQFAWGVMAYALLTRRFPWSEPGDVVRVIADILSMTPAPPGSRGAQLPAWLDDVLLRALAKSRDERFPSMQALLAVFEPARGQPSVRPAPTSGAALGVASSQAAVPSASSVGAASVPATPSPPSHAPARLRGLRLGLAAAGLLVALITLFTVVARSRRQPAPPAASIAAPTRPTAVTALPPPATSNAEALSAHHEGMQGIRDANFDVALRAFQRSVKVDPGFAAGWMRVALVGYGVLPTSEAREAFQKANERRSSLSDRDRAFLDAFEPFVAREPADLVEAERRLGAAVALWPLDAELVEALAYVQLKRGTFAAVIATAERAIAIDPEFADPYSLEGGALAQLGRFPEALSILSKCEGRFPAATDCLKVQTDILEQQGQCAELEGMARRWLGKQPSSMGALAVLANAMVATGKHPDTVIAVLEQRWARLDAKTRPRVELGDRLPLDVLAGDFAAAEQKARELDRLTASDPDESAHVVPAMYSIALLQEGGRELEAGQLAAGYLRRREAWIVDAGSEVGLDPTPRMLRAELRAKLLGAPELVAERTAFLHRWESTLPSSLRGSLWLSAYAQVAEADAHAREALAALPGYSPLPAFVAHGLPDADVGRLYALIGDQAHAAPLLLRATRACRAYKEPFAQTQAYAALGEALEAIGDPGGACRAYAVVLARWGKTTARSVTAERAKKRAAALRCAPPG